MSQEQRFNYDDAAVARDIIASELRAVGLDVSDVKEGILLGSGLGTFTQDHMNAARSGHPDGPVVIPFRNIFKALDVPPADTRVQGHAHELVIGPLAGGGVRTKNGS